MIRRPPRSTLFPTRRSSDLVSVFLRALGGLIDGFRERAAGVKAVLSDPGTLFLIVTSPDRKSTRLNSSHANISYAVFCLKKKNIKSQHPIVSINVTN